MKRLLHVQLLPILSGVQRVSLRIFATLDRSKYEPWLLCATGDCAGPSLISEARKLGVRTHTMPNLERSIGAGDWAALQQMTAIMREHRFDIVHTHSSKTGFLGRIAAKRADVQNIVHTVHGVPFHRYVSPPLRMAYWLAEAAMGPITDHLVLVNQCYQRSYPTVPARRQTTIYNTIDYSAVVPKAQRDDDEIRVLWANRFEPQKDPMHFAQAAHFAVQRRPRLRVLMVGEGPLRQQVTRYIQRHGLTDRIEAPGWRDDVSVLMASHDIFCTSSRWEAFGLVHLEAGAAGLPVVAAAVEGVPEVVRHNETGLLVPPEDPQAMADAIVRLADDETLRRRLGETAARVLPQRFPETAFIEGYHRVYAGTRE